MSQYLKRNILIITILLMCITLLSGCGAENDFKVYGGDLLRYSICIEENKSQIVSCPIIVNKKVDTISFNNFVSKDKELLSVSVNSIDMSECMEYEEYYVYFAILSIGCKTHDKAIDANIDKLLFEIDGKLVEYATPYLNLKNTYYFCENLDCLTEDNQILISGDFTGLYGHFPTEDRKFDLTIAAETDIKIKDYRVTDYLEISNLEINEELYDSNELDISVKEKEDVQFEYTLDLHENVFVDNIIRTSQIIIYEHDSQKYIWVYTPGIYIWKDYTDYGNIKRYIEDL